MYLIIVALTGMIAGVLIDQLVGPYWYWVVMPPVCGSIGYFGTDLLIRVFGPP